MEPVILLEDRHLLILHKPAGLSAESGTAAHPSAEKWALAYLQAQKTGTDSGKKIFKQPYIRVAHRLDRPVSGILVLAKTKTALTNLMGQFERREPKKIYWAAITHPLPHPAGTLTHWTQKDSTGKKALIFEAEQPGTQQCSLSYQTLKPPFDNPFEENTPAPENVLEITLHTGRFHQIRAQLAHIGHPVVGDTQYGGPEWKPNAIQLCALYLTFKHPESGVEVRVTTKKSPSPRAKPEGQP